MSTPKEILRKAREIIADPQHWTQGSEARDVKGNELISVDDPKACKFCMVGALIVAAGGEAYRRKTSSPRNLLYTQLVHLEYGQGIVAYNDTHTHAEVMALFDKALA